MVEYQDEDLQNSHFIRVDLSGTRMHGVMLQNVKITDAWVNNLEISCLLGSLIVNEVDVSSYVRTELQRRHPELARLRATDVDGLRDAWRMIEEWRGSAIDVDARPKLAETLDVRAQRMASVAALLAESSTEDLLRTVASPNGGTTSVLGCVHVVLGEEWAHDRYANRDLDALGAPASD
jgi:hypothetical protein